MLPLRLAVLLFRASLPFPDGSLTSCRGAPLTSPANGDAVALGRFDTQGLEGVENLDTTDLPVSCVL
jgi:hypothetical protein